MADDTTLGPKVTLVRRKLTRFPGGYELLTRVEKLEASLAIDILQDPKTGENWDRAKIVWGEVPDIWSY